MRIYVASSWRNEFQPLVVAELREDGHDVYDFRHPEPGNDGFSWRQVDPEWSPSEAAPGRPTDVAAYLKMLDHPIAERGFKLDMDALAGADACVYVMPCGVSASLEAGYAIGAGKPTAVYVPKMREAELMVKMADYITDDLVLLCSWARVVSKRFNVAHVVAK